MGCLWNGKKGDSHLFLSAFLSALSYLTFTAKIQCMKQTLTIETEDRTVLRLLQNLAEMSLIRFTREVTPEDGLITDRLNELYADEESSLETCYMMAQNEVISKEDW